MSVPVRAAPLGELVSPVKTWTPEREAPSRTFTYVDLSSIDPITKQIVEQKQVLGADAPSRARQVIAAGDVLVSTVRPNLNGVARVPCSLDGSTASTGFCVLRPRVDHLNSAYLFHWVRSPQFVALMVSRATGASYPAVSDRIVRESKIPLPPISAQRGIAEIFDKADALRAKRRATLAGLDTLNQAIFLDMFGDPGTNPRRWPVKPLGEVISIGPQNGLYKPGSDYGTGAPILRIDGFYDGAVTSLNTLKRVRISAQEQSLYGLSEGQIVINRVNSREYLGKSAIIPKLVEPTVFESNMMRFDVCRDTMNPTFLIQYLQTGFVRRHILQTAKDAINQSSINQQDVKAIPVFVPPVAEQAVFAQQLASAVRLKAAQQRSLAELDTLFASLQQRVFRGNSELSDRSETRVTVCLIKRPRLRRMR